MISPTQADIGRKVVYRARHPGAEIEDGVISSFNDACVFVRYGNDTTGKGTRREDLEWLTPRLAPDGKPVCVSANAGGRG